VRDEDKKENMSGWSVTGKYLREVESFATACRMTRSEAADMLLGHALHNFDRRRYITERIEMLERERAGLEEELGRIAEYDAQIRLLANALLRRFIAQHTDKRGKYKHDPVDLSDYIQASVIPRCPGLKYDDVVEIFKAVHDDMLNVKLGEQEKADRAHFDKLMAAERDAKDARTGKDESPSGDSATQG
jgi:hypothetical protein